MPKCTHLICTRGGKAWLGSGPRAATSQLWAPGQVTLPGPQLSIPFWAYVIAAVKSGRTMVKCFKSTMSRGTKDSHELGAYTHQGTWPHTPYWPRRGFTDDASDTHKVQPTSRSPSELVTERVHKPGPQCPYGCAIHLSHRQKVYDTLWCAICMALQGARSFSFYGKCLFWKGT